jgi:orotate phosphoribosyltransferase
MFIRKTKKDYGTAAQVEGVHSAEDRIVLVEDVVTTGGQAIEMIQSLRGQGLDITGVIAVLNRNEGADEAFQEIGVPFWALFSREDFGF